MHTPPPTIPITRRIAGGLLLLAIATGGLAQDAGSRLDQALEKGELRERQAVQAQQRVDQVYDQTRSASDEYKGVLKQIEGLQVYVEQLGQQVVDQQAELGRMGGAIDNVQIVERQIVPLMLRMIDALDQFVALDVPFLLQERRERITRLRALIPRADVTVSEKFRNVMAAYSTEVNYGSTLEAYRGKLDDGREVDLLRLGRVALLYRTLDGKESGRFDLASRGWQVLDRGFNSEVYAGLRIARQQAAPDLVHVPLNTAEAAR